ncbi:hypothetical protein [Pollutibacter soli]|uniref:hypothetical protein n=1 Tax=Pollutibacter soli TaxID=3034157 RepID=UPI003013AC44
MKRLLFYIMAILVMAVFTALLQESRRDSKLTVTESNSVDNTDSTSDGVPGSFDRP